MHKIRCVWCGWFGYDVVLDMNEKDEPAYCPICGHSEFDDRYFAPYISATMLKNTWNRKGTKNNK